MKVKKTQRRTEIIKKRKQFELKANKKKISSDQKKGHFYLTFLGLKNTKRKKLEIKKGKKRKNIKLELGWLI